MTLPSDPQLTKLRIWKDQAERDHEVTLGNELIARRKMERAQVAFHKYAKAIGYCGNCGLTLADCPCLAVAAPV